MSAIIHPRGSGAFASRAAPQDSPGDKPMTMQFTARHSQQDYDRRAKALASDRRMCRRLVALSMPFFIVGTAVERLIRPAAGTRRLSIYAQARARAGATIPFMFMG